MRNCISGFLLQAMKSDRVKGERLPVLNFLITYVFLAFHSTSLSQSICSILVLSSPASNLEPRFWARVPIRSSGGWGRNHPPISQSWDQQTSWHSARCGTWKWRVIKTFLQTVFKSLLTCFQFSSCNHFMTTHLYAVVKWTTPSLWICLVRP